MPITFSRWAEVDTGILLGQSAFDPILDVDTRLFLDPHLLSKTQVAEFTRSYERLQARFTDIARLLLASDSKGDALWRAAERLMIWPEVKGLCIGYTSKGTDGRGMGPVLRGRLLDTATTILRKGIIDPVIFELVGLLENDIGPDLIGDMAANIIRDDLIRYSHRVLKQLPTDKLEKLQTDTITNLPLNPYNSNPVILVPRELLRDLPMAFDWTQRDYISIENEQIRAQVNEMVGETWKQATSVSKSDLKEAAFEYTELLDDLVLKYKSRGAERYDFEEDRAGQYIWAEASQKYTTQYPLSLAISPHPTVDDVEKMVMAICDQFKKLVEDNGLSKLFYDRNKRVKHEEAMQLLFYGIAESYCVFNKIMIARESDAGRGPVDFKFGTNMQNSVLVEVKKSTNTSGMKKGITKQLPVYMNAEGARRAIYLVIDVGYSRAATKNLREIGAAIKGTAIKISHVDGSLKKSGSKA